jgi:hypothetical protein
MLPKFDFVGGKNITDTSADDAEEEAVQIIPPQYFFQSLRIAVPPNKIKAIDP